MMDINDISEITVVFKEGPPQVYRGRGLEKFRKRIVQSPSLGGRGQTPLIIEEDDPCPGGICAMPSNKNLNKIQPVREVPSPSPEVEEQEDPFLSKTSNFAYSGGQGSGYVTNGAGYNYAPTGDNPMAAAIEMQKNSGLNFGM